MRLELEVTCLCSDNQKAKNLITVLHFSSIYLLPNTEEEENMKKEEKKLSSQSEDYHLKFQDLRLSYCIS